MRKNERGFTLVELLVTTALMGLVVTAIGPAIYQLSSVTAFGNERLAANHELQNAAFWFNQDGQMAVSASGGGTLILTLPSVQTITYSLSGASLRRTAGLSAITLAQNISNVNFAVQGRLISMEITSAPQGRMGVSEQGTYKVNMRPVP